jgi:hypothetical protein
MIHAEDKNSPASPLRLKNVLGLQRELQEQLFSIAVNPVEIPPSLPATIDRTTARIEDICERHRVTPAALAAPSRSAYAWMKFLADGDNLEQHLRSLRRAREIGEAIVTARKRESGGIFVELTNGSALYRYSATRELTRVSMSEGFIRADDGILAAVMESALSGKTEESNRKIRMFASGEEYGEVLWELDLIVEIAAESARGDHYDLDELFESVNREYFGGEMEKPRLVWNRAPTERKFGHYERARDRIVISRTLDAPNVPRFAVEFVLYHELLHKYHGVRWVNGKRMIHTSEFRRDEKRFDRYREASAYLDRHGG